MRRRLLTYGGSVLVGGLVALAASGRKDRRYAVYAPDDLVEVAGAAVPLAELAAAYQPRMHLRPFTRSPRLLWVWYEAFPTGTGLDLIYYHCWEDEIHPSPFVHGLYSAFRAAYYGWPLYDIEFFQISVDRDTGAIARLRFETSEDEAFDSWAPEHVTAEWTCSTDGSYRVVHDGRPTRAASPLIDGRRIRLAAWTWNHLVRPIEDAEVPHIPHADSPLRYLTDVEYKRYRFSRRSRGVVRD